MSYNICPNCGEGNGVVNMTIFQCRCVRERKAVNQAEQPACKDCGLAMHHSAGTCIERLKEFAYQCILELSYVECATRLEEAKSGLGSGLIKQGMQMLGVKDLSAETLRAEKGQ